MNLRNLTAGWVLGAMFTFGWTAMAAPSDSQSKAVQSNDAMTLLRGIRLDARMISRHAMRWERMSQATNPRWRAYDYQWNMIKPFQEDMSIKLDRVEGMSATLSPAEQKAVDASKPLVESIGAKTRELRTFLNDRYSEKLSNPAYEKTAAALSKDARKLADVAEAG